MPPSLARPSAAPDRVFFRGFSRPAGWSSDRWPMPVAAAVILALSATAWAILIQAGRLVIGLIG